MPLTDWRLHDAVLFVQVKDDRTEAGRMTAYGAIADLARAHAVRGLVVEPRPFDAEHDAPRRLAHHEAVAELIAASGVSVYLLVWPRACADARHHIFAIQRIGLTARRCSGRDGALALARRLTAEPPR